MKSKMFSQRFNRQLSLLGFPDEYLPKIKAITAAFGVTRQTAYKIVTGQSPSQDQIQKIAEILEVCPYWLAGESDKKERNRVYS